MVLFLFLSQTTSQVFVTIRSKDKSAMHYGIFVQRLPKPPADFVSVSLLLNTSSSETNTDNIFLRDNRQYLQLRGIIWQETWLMMAPEVKSKHGLAPDFQRKPAQKRFRVTRNS